MSSSDNSARARRQAIRREMRQRRRRLSPAQQASAAKRLDKLLARQPLFQRSKRIAFYLPNDGEIDPRPLLRSALARGKRCYLPVLHPRRQGVLWFLPYRRGSRLAANRFGIMEPVLGDGRHLPAHALDLVLLPLVAFDPQGGRLGMGAGFYDRTFAFKAGQKRHSPILVGLAHSCQMLPELPTQAWDIPLRAVASEAGIVACQAAERDFLKGDLLAANKTLAL